MEVFAAEVFSSPLKDEKAFEAVRKLKPKPVSDLEGVRHTIIFKVAGQHTEVGYVEVGLGEAVASLAGLLMQG